MIEEKKPSFAQRYEEALKHHIENRTHGRSTLGVARLLGQDAAHCGSNMVGLVRVHEQSMSALTLPSALIGETNTKSLVSPPGAFLIEALQALEAQEQTSRQILTDTHQRCKEQLSEVTQRHSQLQAESKLLQLERQKLAHQLLIAHEEERKEISRELHDELAQILAGINVRLALIKETGRVSERSIEDIILKTQKMVKESVEMVHRFACRLRPAILDDLGLLPALRSYIKELPGRNGLDIRLSASEEVESLDDKRRTVLYRVVQEALLNVIRHAQAQVVTVTLQKILNQVELEIHDDGKSFQVDPLLSLNTHRRLGLLGMRERVEMVGGKFSIESEVGKGTTVRAEIPIQLSKELIA